MRRSGLLLHITSLPGPFGMGSIGAPARRFLDHLDRMGQRIWQILPLGPVGPGFSPYSGLSGLAGNTLLIDLHDLAADGLLTASDLAGVPDGPHVTFEDVAGPRAGLVRRAAERALVMPGFADAFVRFRSSEGPAWLDDFALFMALRERFAGAHWTDWPAPLAHHDPRHLAAARRDLADEIDAIRMEQCLFDLQWQRLRAEAARRGIALMGDMPLYVSGESADVWAHQPIFKLGPDGRALVEAGVPPDYFSADGQLWHLPVYDWSAMADTDFSWWRQRMARALALTDTVRIDHFRGLCATWEVPYGAPNAAPGQWVETGGAALLQALSKDWPHRPFIAENLGVITPDVEALRASFGLPGMIVLQFALEAATGHDFTDPADYPADTVCYTGTHDNATSREWFGQAMTGDLRHALMHRAHSPSVHRIAQSDETEAGDAMIAAALHSGARDVIIPLQDVLGLGREGRMNVPGTRADNWRWRFQWDDLTRSHEDGLAALTAEAGRLR